MKNHQNFKGIITKEYSIEGTTLRQRIEAIPESVIERSKRLCRYEAYGESLEFDAPMLRIEELQKRVAELIGDNKMEEALKRSESFAREGESYTDVWKAVKKIS